MSGLIDLNGTWQLGWAEGVRGNPLLAEADDADPARFVPALVPGEVHLDLERAGLIDDVRLGLNALKARWVEEVRWTYRREFEAPAAAAAAPGAWLVFEGLDLAARVVLNGQDVGRHQNAFRPCALNVTGKLRAGGNVLVVHLESGLYSVADKPRGRFPYLDDLRMGKRHWLRKAGSQFGWDWAARLVNVGIVRPARLEWASVARIEQLAVDARLSPDLARGTVGARLFVESLREARGVLTLAAGDAVREVPVTLRPGLHAYPLEVDVDRPELWWPAAVGRQRLYPVRVTLSVEGEALGERTARVGFRSVRIVQDPHPAGGRTFILEVNGRKVFAKGANWAPADMIQARCDRPRYARLLGLAREAHFNFLRINGCGLYENDAFYDVCDEQGVMVWQDFPFSNTHYPFGDAEFLAEAEREARWNVRRLQGHPSLVAWCGNNEMEWLGGAEKTRGTDIDDVTFFERDLPRWLAEEDPARYYQRSSPCSPDGLAPNACEAGNQHPWDIGFKNTDFHGYRALSCRFAVEGGALGAPALPTLRACLPPGEERTWSFAWQQHDNAVALAGHPSWQDRMVADWTGRDVRGLTPADYCYWAGVVQGEALREYADNFRRRMFDNAASVFWDFNDTWPVTRGWAIADYYARRAPAFYAVRRAYAPIHVVLACEGDQVVVFGINDGDRPYDAELRYGVFALCGGYPVDRAAGVSLAANASTRLAAFPIAAWEHPQDSAAFAILSREGRVAARNRLFLPKFKDLRWAAPRVTVRREGGRAVFESPVFAWAVCLDLDGEAPLADNFFDLYPGVAHAIEWPQEELPRILKSGNLGVQG